MSDGQRRAVRTSQVRRTPGSNTPRQTAAPVVTEVAPVAPVAAIPARPEAPSVKSSATTRPAKATRPARASAETPTATGHAGVDPSATTQSGSDTRKRGWFWHWNSIVTQFAPMIGLKGVGLLNSYTVWTDRREDSPNRGYAFPSQQSEADFYGEERAELITINKILVALDLIEIRKEMIVKPDAQGRKWRVPHNFYRVKDHDDGYVLSAPAVLGVVHLADRDKNVYRYLRRIFSTRFSPIGHDSVWNQIMPALRQDPVWQRLAAKVEIEERRASDRTRAGHAARQGAPGAVLFAVSSDGDSQTANDTSNDSDPSEGVVARAGGTTSVATGNQGSVDFETVDVATTNRGSRVVADESNNGSPRNRPSSVAGANVADATIVAPTNTTYDQSLSTTMTTTDTEIDDEQSAATDVSGTGQTTANRLGRRIRARRAGAVQPAAGATSTGGNVTVLASDAPVIPTYDHRPTADGGGPDAGTTAIQAYEDANDKPSTPAQRQLLTTLASQFDAAAREGGTGATGWTWVTAAIFEAVESGSAYVAPRRIREILTRWQREGRPSGGDDGPGRGGRKGGRPTGAPATDLNHTPVGNNPSGSRPAPALVSAASPARVRRPTVATVASGPAPSAAATPHRTGARQPGPRAAMGDALATTPAIAGIEPATLALSRRTTLTSDAFMVAECGLASTQVWSAMLTELALGGDVPRADFDGYIRSAELIGRDERGALVIGASSAVTQRRVSRYLPALRQAAQSIVGVALPVEVVVRGAWLAEHPERGVTAIDDAQRGVVG
jgi:hypothetical protein